MEQSPSPPARLYLLPRPFSCRACLYGGGLGGGCKGGCSPEPEPLLAQDDEEEEEGEAEVPPEPSSPPASPPPPPPAPPRSPSPPLPRPSSPPSPPAPRGREASLPSVPPSPTLRRRAKSLPLPGERGLRPAAPQQHPPSPSRRKTVRFADWLGLELAAVRHFSRADEAKEEEEAAVRGSAAAELLKTRKPPALGELEPFLFGPPSSSPSVLEPLFPPSPGSRAGFAERLREQRVQLEWVRAEASGLRGALRVLNLAFEKDVSVRYTLDRWQSALEVPARYQPSALGPDTDRFAFLLPLQEASPPAAAAGLEFALRYRVAGAEYWDNNRGENYRLRSRSSSSSSRAPGPDASPAWIHFI